MSKYNTCPICGANLDPGEKCDCEKEEAVVSAATPTTASVGYGLNHLNSHTPYYQKI